MPGLYASNQLVDICMNIACACIHLTPGPDCYKYIVRFGVSIMTLLCDDEVYVDIILFSVTFSISIYCEVWC